MSKLGPVNIDWFTILHWLELWLPLGIFLLIPLLVGSIAGRLTRSFYAARDTALPPIESKLTEL